MKVKSIGCFDFFFYYYLFYDLQYSNTRSVYLLSVVLSDVSHYKTLKNICFESKLSNDGVINSIFLLFFRF